MPRPGASPSVSHPPALDSWRTLRLSPRASPPLELHFACANLVHSGAPSASSPPELSSWRTNRLHSDYPPAAPRCILRRVASTRARSQCTRWRPLRCLPQGHPSTRTSLLAPQPGASRRTVSSSVSPARVETRPTLVVHEERLVNSNRPSPL